MDTDLTRRSVLTKALAASALAAASSSLMACSGSADDSPADAERGATDDPLSLSTWQDVRDSFPLSTEQAHLAAFVLAAHPDPVRRAIEQWRDALDADPALVLEDEQAHEQVAREAAAAHLGVDPMEVALTDSTTMGLGTVYNGLRLRPGDRILTTTHDFYSSHESLRLAAQRSGARLDVVTLYDDPADATADEMVRRVERGITARTRVVALTWVHSGTGVKIPVRAVADLVADANRGRPPERRAVVCLDAVHGFGASAERPADLGVDVFISGTHKWLFGPRGTGIVWARSESVDGVLPTIPAFYAPSFTNWITGGSDPSPFGLAMTAGGYHSFEHRWALPQAFAFHDAIGVERIASRTTELAGRLKEGLADLPNGRLVTPAAAEVSAGIVCYELDGLSPSDAVATLRERDHIVAGVTPYATPYLRFGPSIVNSTDEVDATIAAVAEL
ncbi:selenocysteine lyase/cysteine desulfurase [Mumia flava]|uniref:Selenocysteine lyase/cysteine desulfurase n=1 Tax=Mumia flava TaxID=1348852 RepID=A0A0B2BP20_9ACTN|nr:aminotransferase class V-fold PLP-dependent enzyme [Mumia flava]PJJ56611.1 selenocysteine lyase/cysteine desulfurase [Mumia flava]